MELPPGTVLLDSDFGTTVINATDVPTGQIHQAMAEQDRPILRALEGWIQSTQGPGAPLMAYSSTTTTAGATGSSASRPNRAGGIFNRDRYLTPSNVFDQMRASYDAMGDDDIVSGIAESTESLAFSAMSFYAEDSDDEDIYNQIAAKIDLDSRMREIWRELFAVSQCYVAVWWQKQHFEVRGKTDKGNARRKAYDVMAPAELSLLNPLKVVPVGNTMFGTAQLAYIASGVEASVFGQVLDPDAPVGQAVDPIVQRLIVGRYEPSRAEAAELSNLNIDVQRLWLLNPNNVFRHTLTRSDYQRFAPVRMKAVFELLDMKHQLRQMERAHLIGGTNFIVVITKGSDKYPALPAELANLQAQVHTIARVPLLIGDHRLNVEIVTPKLDNTLRAERWNTVDSRITARLHQMFMLGNYSAGAAGDDSVKLVKVIARGMESRRHMIRRTLEKQIFTPLFERNDVLSSAPKLMFHPRAIALDFDPNYATFLFDLRQANEISRETILNQFDLDQNLEAEYRKREKDSFDDIFQTQVPFSVPNPAAPTSPPQPAQPGQPAPGKGPRDNGGGNRNGGGAAPGTGQGQAPRRATRPKPKQAAASAPIEVRITVDGVDAGSTPESIRSAIAAAFAPDDGDTDA